MYIMPAQKNGIFAKMGLSEPQEKLVKKTFTVSAVICALLIAGYWGYGTFTAKKAKDAAAPPSGANAETFSPEVTAFDIDAHEFTAKRYLQSGRPGSALPHLRRIAAVTKDERISTRAYYDIVRAQVEIGDFGGAIETADRILEKIEDSLLPSLQVRRAIAFYHVKRYDESSGILKEVLEHNPYYAPALCFMGEMEAAAQTRSPTAERFFRRALKADSNYLETKYQFARYFENNGDYKNAKSFLLQVLDKEPLNVRAHARLGMIYYYEKDLDMALKSYQTALALNPSDYNTLYNLGELYRTLLNDNENALKSFVAALEYNPTHSEANYKAGLVCVENEMFKEAIRYFEASLEDDRKNIRRLLQLAAAYERINDRGTALSVYKEITDIDPLNSIAIQKIKYIESEPKEESPPQTEAR
jgi:tetratricopeptide (TPR) repeat protein